MTASENGFEENLGQLLAWVILKPHDAVAHIHQLRASSRSYDDMLLGFRGLFVQVLEVIDYARKKESEHNAG